jgi:hypothetical protein
VQEVKYLKMSETRVKKACFAGSLSHGGRAGRWRKGKPVAGVAQGRACGRDLTDGPPRGHIQHMTDTLPPPVQAILTAANAGDTAGFLACFTPNGVVDDWGREFRGAEAIQGWSDAEFIGVNVTLAVTAVETTVTADVGGDGFNGPSHFSFQVQGDLVARMTIRA